MGAGVASDDELGGADEVVGSLVGGQEAEIADEEAVGWDAEAAANILKVGSASSGWRGRKRVRSTPSVTATTRFGGKAGVGDKGVSGVLGTGENAVGKAVGEAFEP